MVLITPFLLFLLPWIQNQSLFWGVSSLQFLPWRSLALQSVLNGEIPLWNPYVGAGAPLLANYQLAFFYPPNWIQLPFFMQWDNPGIAMSYNLLIPLHLAWAGLGMYFLLKEFKCGSFARAVGAIAFSLCSYLFARLSFISIIWTAAWLPWVMYGTNRFVVSLLASPINFRKVWLNFLLLGGAVWMLLLAGHAQTAWYTLLIAITWGTVLGFSLKKWKGGLISLTGIGGAFLMAGLAAAIQLVPTLEFLIQSQRATSIPFENAMTYSFWPWRLITLPLPDFFGNPGIGTFWGYGNYWEDASYIGIIPLILAGYALVERFRSRDSNSVTGPEIYFFASSSILFFILALGKNTPIYPFLFRTVPTFDMFQAPARWMILVCFSLVILAGFGAEVWEGNFIGNKRATYLFLVLSLAAGLSGFLAASLIPTVPQTMSWSLIRLGILGSVASLVILIAGRITNKQANLLIASGILLITCTDLLSNNFLLNPFASSNLYASTVKPSDSPIMDKRTFIPSSDEYDLKFTRFFRTHDFRPIENWEHLRIVDLPDINILNQRSYLNNFDPMIPAGFQTIMESINYLPADSGMDWLRVLNVDKIEEIDISSPMGIKFTKIADSHYFHSFSCQTNHRETILPSNSESLITSLQPEEPVIINSRTREVIATNCVPTSNFQIQSASGSNNILRVEYSTIQDSFVELATTWYPGWTAEVDGIQTEVFQANGVLNAIYLPEGTHTLTLEFDPQSFKIGLAITIFTLAIVTTVSLIFIGKNHSGKSHESKK